MTHIKDNLFKKRTNLNKKYNYNLYRNLRFLLSGTKELWI